VGEPPVEDILRSEWVFVILLIPVLIYLIVSLMEKYSLTRIVRIVFSNKFAYTIFRNTPPGAQVFQILLGVLSMVSISTFLMFMQLHFDIRFYNLKPHLLWMANMGFISIVISLRYIVNLIIGIITRSGDTFREYFFNISRGYKLFGIILMVLNFLISYLVSIPDLYIIYLSLVIFAIIYIFRAIRLASIFIRKRFSLFYMILYLCALEFFPALVLIRYLSGQEY
jgi:hypothetical protein